MLPLRNVPNNGEKAKYYAEGTQQAIVSREDFGLVRQMIAERSQKGKPPNSDYFCWVDFLHHLLEMCAKSCDPYHICCVIYIDDSNDIGLFLFCLYVMR